MPWKAETVIAETATSNPIERNILVSPGGVLGDAELLDRGAGGEDGEGGVGVGESAGERFDHIREEAKDF